MKAFSGSRFNSVFNQTVVAFLSIICIAGSALADREALDFTSLAGGGQDYTQGTYSLGWQFTPNRTISVTALGFYDDLKNGITGNHPVGIFTSPGCQLVASTSVVPSDPLTGFFRYHSITPVSLTAGQQYYIAAVTLGDKYAIGVPNVNIDSAITYVGYAYAGDAFQGTTSLECPNGGAIANYHGDYGPSFLIGDTTAANRKAAISLFCNRVGPTLSTADCTVSVADSSVSSTPRIPGGTVSFTTTNGFSPASGSCTLQKSQFSLFVSSCDAQFAVPLNFPLGVAFPIDADYLGDSNFDPASTSHKLIFESCVGTVDTPCTDSVGITFPELPIILDESLLLQGECGPGSEFTSRAITTEALKSDPCVIQAGIEIDLAAQLNHMSPGDFRKFAAHISSTDAGRFPALANLRRAAKSLTDAQLRIILQSDSTGSASNTRLINLLKNGTGLPSKLVVQSSTKKKPAQYVFAGGSVTIKLKANSQKSAKLKLSSTGRTMINLVRRSGVSQTPLTLKVSTQRTSQKKPKAHTAKISIVLH